MFSIPSSTIEWSFNNSLISTDDTYVINEIETVNESGLSIQVSTLSLLSVSRDSHGGKYTCTAANGVANLIDSSEITTAILTVQGIIEFGNCWLRKIVYMLYFLYMFLLHSLHNIII